MRTLIEALGGLRARPWLLAFSLGLLHLGLVQGVTTTVGRGLMIGHLGAVLLWQPLVRQDRQLGWGESLLGAALIAVLGTLMSDGLALLWVLVLSGLLGAELLEGAAGRARLSYWAAQAYLIMALVGLVLPELLPDGAGEVEVLVRVVAWGGPLVLVLVPGLWRAVPRAGQRSLDFVGGLVLVLVLSGVLLGALALMFVTGAAYLPALLQSLGMMALGLLLLAWAWSPGSGAGLSLAVARHALSGGAPFAQWLDQLAGLSVSDADPEALVREAVARLPDWPVVQGVAWRIERAGGQAEGFAGRRAARQSELRHGALVLVVHSRHELAVLQLWQIDLMLRVLAEFYAAREQSRYMQSMSYLRAVHETGARMTHEIKNLLQSVDTLCFAMEEAGRAGRSEALQALVSRQLPLISQRLHAALERIRQPEADEVSWGRAASWWQTLQARQAGAAVAFLLIGEPGEASVPVLLFDTVADNLLRNALEKPDAGQVRVGLQVQAGVCSLWVEDEGAAMTPERSAQLFLRPMPSDRGLGIGLYQAARLAESLGYALVLAINEPGRVRFVLAPRRAAASGAGA